ncbi:hypothetical protein [Natronolimnohabitans innermongolicus]|uniref:Uncharacterized protein n=1 Tax=Natronolimnohabitans innermongolicus JCM 12255 TaxID=1227499 RepID=L9WZX5_9EURY|nr:hypothetical protein [Natronolimnohabitans innermongolicus]ELY55029.1 hypothetical protein C493_11797 [Natronolimnohabitans innermongolicus JCM 12255]
MPLRGLLSGDPSRNSKIYLAIGAVSLVKAIALRKDQTRFRRELVDAGLFIGVGLALRQYSQLKEEKRAEIEETVPDWAIRAATSPPAQQGVRSFAKRQLGGEPEPEQESGLRGKAKNVVSR